MQNLVRALKTLLGLMAGSLASSLIFYPLLDQVTGDDARDVAYMLGRSTGGALAVFILALPLGVLGHAILYRLKRRALWSYLILAALIGLGLGMIIGRDTAAHSRFHFWIVATLWGALLILVAWLIRRPDRDKSTTPTAESHF